MKFRKNALLLEIIIISIGTDFINATVSKVYNSVNEEYNKNYNINEAEDDSISIELIQQDFVDHSKNYSNSDLNIFSYSNTLTALKCRDPNINDLKHILAKCYKASLNKIIDGIEEFPPLQQKYKNFILNASTLNLNHNFAIYGNSSCSRNRQTVWHPYEVFMCPYHFVQLNRLDRFPFSIKHAVCNCANCIGSNSKFKKCTPNYIVKPVLVREGCLNNGYFKWKYTFEYVPISCSCKQFIDID